MSDPIVFIKDMLAHDVDAVPASLQLRRQEPWELGQLILYRYQVLQRGRQPPEQEVEFLGCQVFRQTPEGRQPCGGSGFSLEAQAPRNQVVQFTIAVGHGESVRYVVLYGRALTPEAQGVEVELDNGRVMRAPCVNSVFALTAANVDRVIAFRVYDNIEGKSRWNIPV